MVKFEGSGCVVGWQKARKRAHPNLAKDYVWIRVEQRGRGTNMRREEKKRKKWYSRVVVIIIKFSLICNIFFLSVGLIYTNKQKLLLFDANTFAMAFFATTLFVPTSRPVHNDRDKNSN